jgi:hypothetical protein
MCNKDTDGLDWVPRFVFASCPTAWVISAPGRRAVVIAAGRKFIGTCGALLQGLLAVAPEHEVGGAQDINLGYHAAKAARLPSIKVAGWRRY